MAKALRNIKVRIIGILILTMLRFGFACADALASPNPVPYSLLLENFIGSLVVSTLTWESNRLLVVLLNRRSGFQATRGKRFGLEALLVLALNSLVYAAIIGVMLVFHPSERPPLVYLFFGMWDRWICGYLVAGFYELVIFFNAVQVARQEADELKKLNITIQLESLKNQVKPHFLFNSLNTLTGLVESNSEQAVRFIAELANVYRYLLQSSEKELIALREELQFSRAYFFLLQMRFGDGIRLLVNIDEELEDCQLPPLTLQMLLENCIKHNQVSARKPLQMEITAEGDGWLVVKNNLQERRTPVSNGMGLSNIAAKLKLLNQPAIEVEKTDACFTIKIPLIKPVTA